MFTPHATGPHTWELADENPAQQSVTLKGILEKIPPGKIVPISREERDRAATALIDQLASLDLAINSRPEGSYFIDDLKVTDLGTERLKLFTWLMAYLTKRYNNYQWSYSEALRSYERGITVRWKKLPSEEQSDRHN